MIPQLEKILTVHQHHGNSLRIPWEWGNSVPHVWGRARRRREVRASENHYQVSARWGTRSLGPKPEATLTVFTGVRCYCNTMKEKVKLETKPKPETQGSRKVTPTSLESIFNFWHCDMVLSRTKFMLEHCTIYILKNHPQNNLTMF